MVSRRENGFTLIEVVVAFAIFALSIGAIFELFQETLHRSTQVRERDIAWLTARSVLSRLRTERAPWPRQQNGTSGRLRWSIDVQPYPIKVDVKPAWIAYRVEVHVAPAHSSAPAVELDSVELARYRQ